MNLMVKIIKAVFLVIILLIGAPSSYAATVYKNAIQMSSYDLIFTKVKINGKEVLALIDSGSFRTIELSSTLAQELKIPLVETTKIARRYEGKDFYLKSGQIDKLSVGNYERQKVAIDVVEGDIENISKQVNTNFEVILGWGFISQFYTQIDYRNLSMQFSESPLEFNKDKLNINYSVVNYVPVIKGIIDNRAITFLFDTGAPMCNLDVGIAGAPKNEKISKELQIENNKFLLEWRVKDLTAIKKSLGTDAVIGNNFLKNYTVYFDTKNKVIHLY